VSLQAEQSKWRLEKVEGKLATDFPGQKAVGGKPCGGQVGAEITKQGALL
jgi:hypothetical protein